MAERYPESQDWWVGALGPCTVWTGQVWRLLTGESQGPRCREGTRGICLRVCYNMGSYGLLHLLGRLSAMGGRGLSRPISDAG